MTPSTDELDIRPEILTRAELRRVASSLLREEQTGTTDYICVPYDPVFPRQRTAVWSIAAAVLTSFGSAVLRSGQAPTTDPLRTAITRFVKDQEEERVADFFEVVRYNWDRCLHKARVAAREYSEHTHADY